MRIALVFIFINVFTSFGQPQRPKNYSKFDTKTFHFGIMMGGNSSGFSMYQKLDAYADYGLKSLTNQSSPGGQIGPVISMNLGTPVVRLRFVPNFSFQEKVLNYAFEDISPDSKGDFINQERINSSNFDFPLMLQFRTVRLNNFASYILTGAQFSWDMQTQQNASQNYIDPFIKLRGHDWQAQLGTGIEFFLPYFKLGMEIKYSHGWINSFIQDDTQVAAPIDRLYNKVWSFSLIFEG